MKKITFLLVFISIFGYSQNPIQTISKNLNKKLDLKNSKFRLNEVNNFNRNQKSNKINFKSFNREIIVNQEVSYRLDSSIVVGTRQREFTKSIYDENGCQIVSIYSHTDIPTGTSSVNKSVSSCDDNGNVILIDNFSWNVESQSYVPLSKMEYSYDDNGNLLTESHIPWRAEYQSFYKWYTIEYIYDDNGNIIIRKYEDFDNGPIISPIINKNKWEYTYDDNGNQTLIDIYNWNFETQSYEYAGKYEDFYDDDGNHIIYSVYGWDTESQSHTPLQKREYFYDDNGNRILLLNYNQNFFVPQSKEEYSYDDDGNQILFILSFWKNRSSSFVPSYKREYSYDENGNQTLYVFYNWSSFLSSYVPTEKEEHSYDDDGNQIQEILYDWSQVNDSFEPTSLSEHSYDDDGNLIQEILYDWNDWSQINLSFCPIFKMNITTFSETDTALVREGIIYEYDTNSDTWNELEGDEYNKFGVKGYKSFWYYTNESSLSNNSEELNSFSIYPNPTNDKLFIQGLSSSSRVSIYNVLGKLVLSQTISKEIDVKQLSKGVYILKIIDEQKETVRKFIKD
jgi:hypothetical protein